MAITIIKIARVTAESLVLGCATLVCQAAGVVTNDSGRHVLTLSDAKRDLVIRVNYDHACYLDSVLARGREVVSQETGVCTGIKVAGRWLTTRNGLATPTVEINGNEVVIKEIQYSNGGIGVRERWTFDVANDQIGWSIDREYLNAGSVEDTYFPGWDFRQMDTWTGGNTRYRRRGVGTSTASHDVLRRSQPVSHILYVRGRRVLGSRSETLIDECRGVALFPPAIGHLVICSIGDGSGIANCQRPPPLQSIARDLVAVQGGCGPGEGRPDDSCSR